MEQIVNNDYQEVYRIKNGVLLTINKFEYINFPGHRYRTYLDRKEIKTKKFGGAATKDFRIVTKGCTVSTTQGDVLVKKGTVLHCGYRIQPISNHKQWEYTISTTADSFQGNLEEMQKYMEEIQELLSSILKSKGITP